MAAAKYGTDLHSGLARCDSWTLQANPRHSQSITGIINTVCFVVIWQRTILQQTSLTQWKSYDCPRESTLRNMIEHITRNHRRSENVIITKQSTTKLSWYAWDMLYKHKHTCTWKRNWRNSLYMLTINMERKHTVDSRLAPSQWETSLQSNTFSQWLGANLESAL